MTPTFAEGRAMDLRLFIVRRELDEHPRVTKQAYLDWLSFHAATNGKAIPSKHAPTTAEIRAVRRELGIARPGQCAPITRPVPVP